MSLDIQVAGFEDYAEQGVDKLVWPPTTISSPEAVGKYHNALTLDPLDGQLLLQFLSFAYIKGQSVIDSLGRILRPLRLT
jgi:hypothetical protein